ncbi:MAG: radical SAM family heme chaperone HemW [Bacteroidota bacterium]|nr:radical SAM family heme chaperone HemW [Bacteroidota bacterium]
MAGIYIHIPFCKRKCFYCDFHKSTHFTQKNEIISGICTEILLRKSYLSEEPVETIYFGGGTPSILPIQDIKTILSLINKTFRVCPDAEITLEANPDDLNPDYCNTLIQAGINRLSIGIQSFNDKDLKLMNRRHCAQDAVDSVKNAQKAGFNNISIDLIYGLPEMKLSDWLLNLDQAFALNIQHLSAYHLTYHENTVFHQYLKKGKIKAVPEDDSFAQFNLLIEQATRHKFIHYEISNFALPGYFSRHNSSYWQNKKYLGVGPSAHSFDGHSRQWNSSDNNAYLEALNKNLPFYEREELSLNDRYNDYIITTLRTIWGSSLSYIHQEFGESYLKHAESVVNRFKDSGHLIVENEMITLSREGLFVSDDLMTEFMIV